MVRINKKGIITLKNYIPPTKEEKDTFSKMVTMARISSIIDSITLFASLMLIIILMLDFKG